MKQAPRRGKRCKGGALLLGLLLVAAACASDDDDGSAASTGASAVDGADQTTAPAGETTASVGETTVEQTTTTVAPLSSALSELPALRVPEAEIDPDATVRFSVALVEQQLDPHKVTQSFNDHIFYDSVFQLDKDLNVMPGIGTGFTLSDDGKTLDITIRDDATFADGTRVDAAAVKASLDRARTLPESVVKGRLAGITEITVVDPTTVRLQLSEPDATMIFVLATNAGMVINPKALTDGTDLGTTTAGSTPYDLVEYTPGSKFVAVRRDGFKYWDPAAWKIKRIEFNQVTDQTAAINGLLTDVFDSIRLTLPTDAAQQQIGPDYTYSLPPANSMRAIMLRDTQQVFSDPTVRQAVAHAIDLKSIATNVLNRCDYDGQLVRQGDPAYIEGYEPLAYDPEKAKELLAGRTPSFEILVASTQPEENNLAQVAQQQLAAVGITATITPYSLAEASQQFQSGSRDSFIQGSTGQADLALAVSFQFFGPNALAGTPELQSALRAGLAAANALPLGSDERAAALQELQKQALESAVFIPACHLSQYYASDKNLVGMDDNELTYSGSFSVRYLVWKK
jgi:peptide/nickel transport system substrate-binding protein